MLYDSTWHKMVIRKLLKLDINLYESWWPVKSANAHTYTFTHSQLYKKYGFRRRIGGNFFQFHKCTGWSVTDKILDVIGGDQLVGLQDVPQLGVDMLAGRTKGRYVIDIDKN